MHVIIIQRTIDGSKYVALYETEPQNGVSQNKQPDIVAHVSLNTHPIRIPKHIYKWRINPLLFLT